MEWSGGREGNSEARTVEALDKGRRRQGTQAKEFVVPTSGERLLH